MYGAAEVPADVMSAYADELGIRSAAKPVHQPLGRMQTFLFVGAGFWLLCALFLVPIWNAVSLMAHANYVFWFGSQLPVVLICLCAGIAVLYLITMVMFFNCAKPIAQNDEHIYMIATIFVTLLGLTLMLWSMPLSHQSAVMSNDLMNKCEYGTKTHRVYEFATVLQNIRSMPDCITQYSVESCSGYQPAPPYTTYIKDLEANMKCSGFCGTTVSVFNVTNIVSSIAFRGLVPESQGLDILPIQGGHHIAGSRYPPTLFSDANYKLSCNGAAARDIEQFAGGIAWQSFYLGLYLVVATVTTGLLRFCGVCISGSAKSRTF